MTIIDQAMDANRLARAKLHIYNVCRTGHVITLINPATKDEMGEILTESSQDLYAFPVRFNPYERVIKEKVSWAEDTDILCFISKKQIDDLGISLEKIRRSNKLKHMNKMYQIRYVEAAYPFAGDYLYVMVGGKK